MDIKKVKYAVEASSYEAQCLWEKWHTRINWVSGRMGTMCTVGYVNDLPVNVELNWNTINGIEVLFYHACSRIVDHTMVEEWILKNALIEGVNQADSMTDAQNFHVVANQVRG